MPHAKRFGMNPKLFLLVARVAVFAAVCAILASLRYSLTQIFVRGFLDGDDQPMVDGRLILLSLGCAALLVAAIEGFSRLTASKRLRFSVHRSRLGGRRNSPVQP